MSILKQAASPTTTGDLSRQNRPAAYYWALLGGAIVVLNLIIYIGWGIKGRHVATPLGPDPVPTSAKIGVWVFQVSSCVLAVAAITYVTRQSIRQRRLTFDATVVIGWALASWQDPLINWVKPAFFYNAYFLNFGGWGGQIPGWSSPRGSWLPEDIIGTAGVGYLWFVFVMIAACALMRAARRRWPNIGPLGLFGVAFVVCGVFDIVVEVYCVHLHLWAYPGAIHSLSLFGGTINQFPLYETLFWGSVWCALSLLRFYRDDRGNSVVERGVDEMPLGIRGKTLVRTLAITAAINVVFLVYSIAMIWTTMLPGNATPDGFPSYLRDGLCGDGTPYQCPSPTTPIPVRGQPVTGG